MVDLFLFYFIYLFLRGVLYFFKQTGVYVLSTWWGRVCSLNVETGCMKFLTFYMAKAPDPLLLRGLGMKGVCNA